MPLYKTIKPNSQTLVKIWHIDESYDDLISVVNLKPESLERVLGMKSELHQEVMLLIIIIMDKLLQKRQWNNIKELLLSNKFFYLFLRK